MVPVNLVKERLEAGGILFGARLRTVSPAVAKIVAHSDGGVTFANLDDILQVPDFDPVDLGIHDISQAVGYPGQVDHRGRSWHGDLGC
jgi:hypothetical protein